MVLADGDELWLVVILAFFSIAAVAAVISSDTILHQLLVDLLHALNVDTAGYRMVYHR